MTEQEEMIQVAEEKLDAARYLLNGEKYDSAVSSAYYASFHAAKALLLEKESQPKTHQGISSELGKLYREELGSEMTRNFSQIQTRREEADYSTNKSFDEADAEDSIRKSEELIDKARDILDL